MSVSGLSSSNFFANQNPGGIGSKFQQTRQDFQQLGQDLKSGNLSQAQSDLSALQQLLPGQSSTSPNATQTTNPVSQTVAQLGQDLKAGNLSAAQSDFATLQQDLQQQGTVSGHRSHHHHHAGGARSSDQHNSPATLFGELGQELQSGNIGAAQQTYSALQQEFLQFASTGGSTSLGSSSSHTATSASLNVSA